MGKHYFYYLFLLIFTFIFISPIQSQDSGGIEKKIINAGMHELPAFLKNIPEGHEKQYGFDSREQFNQVIPGRPIRIYSLSDESGTINSADVTITPQNIWFIPLIVNNKYIAILTVTGTDNDFSAVDFGAKDLSAELNGQRDEIENPNYETGILRVYNIQSDFFLFSQKARPDKINSISPLKSAQIALKLVISKSKSMTVEETKSLICKKLAQVKNNNSYK